MKALERCFFIFNKVRNTNKFNLILAIILLTVAAGLPRFVQAKCESGNYLVQFVDEQRPRTMKPGSLMQIADWGRDKAVRYIEPDHCYDKAITPTDTYLPKQWYLSKIKAREAWNLRHDAKSIVVAVLDSGIDITHPDLRNNIWINKGEATNNKNDDDDNGFMDDINGWNFVDNNNNPSPAFKDGYTSDILHGTIVAGIIGAEGNNGEGIAGIAWQTQLMPLKVLDDNGTGDSGDVLRAIDYAIANHADIINLSFVGEDYSQGLDEAIKRAYDAGIIVVAAAGNNSLDTADESLDKKPLYPICLDGYPGENRVIGVAATDAIDQKTNFSGYGRRCVDLTAPGISIFSTSVHRPDKTLNNDPLNQYYDGYWSGTSLSAPMVTGTLALIKAVNPTLSRRETIDVLLKSATSIDKLNPAYAGQLGFGRLDAEKALIDAKLRISQDENNIIASAGKGNSLIRTFEASGKLLGQFSAFDKNFKGGTRVATGDVDGDREPELVVVPASQGGPQVKIFSKNGHLKRSFMALDGKTKSGLTVLVDDINGDKRQEIIIASAGSYAPIVQVFSGSGRKLKEFLAYDRNFRSGISLASFDIDNDETKEIATAPMNGGGPQVKFFRSTGQLVRDFWPLSKKYRGGLQIDSADFSGRSFDRQASLIISPKANDSSEVLIFNNRLELRQRLRLADKRFKGNLSISAADFNRDGIAEIAAASQTANMQEIRIYSSTGIIYTNFTALPSQWKLPINLSFIKQ
jgi:subtilisin family serine protease